jgi:hypothetical protein
MQKLFLVGFGVFGDLVVKKGTLNYFRCHRRIAGH